MSKRSNRKKQKTSGGRGFNPTSSGTTLPRLSSPLHDWNKAALLDLARRVSGIDNRQYTPVPRNRRERALPYTKSVTGSQAPVNKLWSKGRSLHEKLVFEDPKIATPCVQRQTRKEVMHAYGFAGRKFGKGRKVRRNENSHISC